jgi:hypothetical protein
MGVVYLQAMPLATALNELTDAFSDMNVTHIWLEEDVIIRGDELPQKRSINSDTGPGPSRTCT